MNKKRQICEWDRMNLIFQIISTHKRGTWDNLTVKWGIPRENPQETTSTGASRELETEFRCSHPSTTPISRPPDHSVLTGSSSNNLLESQKKEMRAITRRQSFSVGNGEQGREAGRDEKEISAMTLQGIDGGQTQGCLCLGSC